MFLGPTTTAGKIDEYETRFTIVNGAHFLIAGNGKEAWPVSAAEADAFKARYRGRMILARWLRRGIILTPILIVLLNIFLFVDASLAFKKVLGTIAAIAFAFGIPLSFLMHTLVSDLTRRDIERGLQRRLTTRLPEAVTPQLSTAGWVGRRLLWAFAALEIGMAGLHLLLGRDALAEHMRIMHQMGNGREGWLALLTGNLAWVLQFVLIIGIILLLIDRRARRKAGEQEKVAQATLSREEERAALLRQLADAHRGTSPAGTAGAEIGASGQEFRQIGEAGGHAGRVVFGRNARGNLARRDGHFGAAGRGRE